VGTVNLLVIAFLSLVTLPIPLVLWLLLRRRTRMDPHAREMQEMIVVLSVARLSYPHSDSDITALDELYQHLYKRIVALKWHERSELKRLVRQAELAMRLRNRLIAESVKFEEKYGFLFNHEIRRAHHEKES
jgi:hypothetical protein